MRQNSNIKIKYALLYLSVCIILNCLPAIGQNNNPITNTHLDSFHLKKVLIKPTTDFDQRFSYIDNKSVNIWGYRIGVVVNDKYKVGIGGYMTEQLTEGNIVDESGTPLNLLKKSLYYGTVYFEPFLFRKKRWEMSLLLELGYGNAILDSTVILKSGIQTKAKAEVFIPAGVGLSVNFIMPEIKGVHFLTYMGLNAMMGIRGTVYNSNRTHNYNGFYWSVGTAFFIDKIFTDLKLGKKRKS